MVKVVGPAFSLAATGSIGSAIFYYDHPYGAMVRGPRRKRPENVAQIFTLNQTWFEAANTRSKTLTKVQREAWQKAYPGICDNWRDIFMGKQIEAWNMFAGNDLTWPQITVKKLDPPVFHVIQSQTYLGRWVAMIDEKVDEYEKVGAGVLVWKVLDNPAQPGIGSVTKESTSKWNEIILTTSATNYIWAGIRYIDGTWDINFLESIVK